MRKHIRKIVSLLTITTLSSQLVKGQVTAPALTYPGPQTYTAGTSITTLSPVNTGGAVPATAAYTQTSSIGSGFYSLFGIVTDAAHNIYVAGGSNNVIYKINPAGIITTFVGSGNGLFVNGTGTAASFNTPQGLAIDPLGNLYVTDSGNDDIRKVDPYGVVTTVAGTGNFGNANGTGTSASFMNPVGIAIDAGGNLYVADAGNNLIRKITPAGVVSTLAGSGTAGYIDGNGIAASFNNPQGIAVDASGNVYVSDLGNEVIRKITSAGVVSTLAGTPGNTGAVNGTGSGASFYNPYGLAVDLQGNIYVADLNNNLIREITPAGVVSTLAGGGTVGDDIGTSAGFQSPLGLYFDPSGNLFTVEYGNVREISLTGYQLNSPLPTGLAFDPTTGNISGTPLASTAAATYTVTGYNTGGSSPATISIAVTGPLTAPTPSVSAPAIAYASPQNYTTGTAINTLMPTNTGGTVPVVAYGETTTLLTNAFGSSSGITIDAFGNIYYSSADANAIQKITPGGSPFVFAGSGSNGFANGTGTSASFSSPQQVALDPSGNLYVADAGNNIIRKITSTGVVSTFAGTGVAGHDDGPAATASFYNPAGVAVDSYGNVYVSDNANNLIRKISPSGIVSTIAGSGNGGYADGTGSSAVFNRPGGLSTDGVGNIYVIDNSAVRKITPAGVVTTIAGTPGASGAVNGVGTAASFNNPQSLVLDILGNIYVTDAYNQSIRRVTPAGLVTTLSGSGGTSAFDGIGTAASFYFPGGIAIDAAGNLYVSGGGGDVRKVSTVGYAIASTLPTGLTFDPTTGNITGTPELAATASAYNVTAYNIGGNSTASVNITVTGSLASTPPVSAPSITYATPQSYTAGNAISTLSPANTGGTVPAVAYGQTATLVSGFGTSYGIVTDATGNIYYANGATIEKINPAGDAATFAGLSTGGTFNSPKGLAIDATGNIYLADGGANLIRKISPAGVVTTFAGSGNAGAANGPGNLASFSNPFGIAVDKFSNVYVADNFNNLIRKISPTGEVTTLAGSGSYGYVDGTGTAASFAAPYGIAVDGLCNVYVADFNNQVIRKITPGGVVTTIAGASGTTGAVNGTGSAASFYNPSGVAVDPVGDVYVSDLSNYLIRKITPSGVVTTLAGSGNNAGQDGIGIAASFYGPQALNIDASGNLWVADGGSVRKVSAVGYSIVTALPAGLTFDPTSGNISGTPVVDASAANYAVTAYNTGGSSTANISITVAGTLTAPATVSAPAISYATPQSYTSGTAITSLAPTNSGGAIPAFLYGQTTTYAGTGAAGSLNGPSASAVFNGPANTAADLYGNVYFADYYNNVIRKISSNGIVSTLAGGGAQGYADGTGTAASFSEPTGVAVDVSGNVYVADKGNQVIRKITPAGVVTTIAGTAGTAGYADGTGTAAIFNYPTGLAVDASKNIYVADEANDVIRKITSAGVVTTLAGSAGNEGYANGTGTVAMFEYPFDVAVDAGGNVYVADQYNQAIRKITSAGLVSTLAGNGGSAGYADGTGSAAFFNTPNGITVDKAGNVYVADYGNNLIRKINSSGVVTTIAGNRNSGAINGVGTIATFNGPQGICTDGSGNLYIGDSGNNLIRKITITGYTTDQALPAGLTLNGATGVISGTPSDPLAAANYLITATNAGGSNSATVNITVAGTAVAATAVAAPKISYASPQNYTAGTAISSLAPVNSGGAVPAQVYAQTSTVTTGSYNAFGVTADATGNLYVAEYNNQSIYKILPSGESILLAGSGNGTGGATNGKGTAASFSNPQGLASDAAGNLYLADNDNQLIRKISPTGVVTTFAGTAGVGGSANGTGTAATFYSPIGVVVDISGNVYVTEQGNNLVRKITPAGVVTTFAGSGNAGYIDGTGTAASFNSPRGITIDASGNLYVCDVGNLVIRKITPAGVVTTLAGTPGNAGFVNGTGSSASFNAPEGITVDAQGNLYVTDQNNNAIRMVTSAGVVSTLAGGNYGTTDGVGTNADFPYPIGITINKTTGNLYVGSEGYGIREISLSGYSIIGTLPVGLNFDTTTGIISGTPTLASSATTYSVTAFNQGGSNTTTVSIAVTGNITPPANPVSPPAISYSTPQSYIAGASIPALTPTNTGGAVPATIYGEVGTFVPGLANMSNGLATDAAGNVYYGVNNQIYKATPAGIITVIAGNGSSVFANGTGTAAGFNNIQGLAVDASENIYVADIGDNSIRKITPAGVVTTLAGNNGTGYINGPGNIASFNSPEGIAVDNYGNVYVADAGNNVIRKVSASGEVSTLAGSGNAAYADGTGTAASFSGPWGVAVDGNGNVYVADAGNNIIRKISLAGVVTTLAGNAGSPGAVNGTGTAASFYEPEGISIDAIGNLYIADTQTGLIRTVTQAGVVSTLSGSGIDGQYNNGTSSTAKFYFPTWVATDSFGNLYESDRSPDDQIRKISFTGYSLNGGTLPAGLDFDVTTGIISGTPTLATAATNYSVTAYNLGGSNTAALSITVTGAITPPVNPVGAPVISYATPQSYAAGTSIAALTPANTGGAVPAKTYAETTSFISAQPGGMATDAAGNVYYTSNGQLYKYTTAGVTSILAGGGTVALANGTGTAASFNNPEGIAIDASGNIYVADQGNNAIRKVTPAGVVTTLAGGNPAGSINGPAALASFNSPGYVAVDTYGNVYVADISNYMIREISTAGEVTTLAGNGSSGETNGTGSAANFGSINGIAVDGFGNVFVGDPNWSIIRKITPAGVVTTFAGSGNDALANGTGTAASFYDPYGISIDATGNLYVADYQNNVIRKITPAAVVTTLAGNGTVGSTNGVGTNASFYFPLSTATDALGNLYEYESNGYIRKISLVGYALGSTLPAGLAFDSTTGIISGTPLTDITATNYTVTGYNTGGSSMATVSIAVTGTATTPTAPTVPAFSYPTPQTYAIGFPISLLIPTSTGGAIPATIYGQVSTFAGNGSAGFDNGTGTMASFNNIQQLACDLYGNIYEADAGNNVIRRITPAGVVTTFAGSGNPGLVNGTGTAASFNNPLGVAVDAGNNVYVSDDNNQVIRKISPNAVVTTFAGSGNPGFANGTGTATSFNDPGEIAVDKSGNVYVADQQNYAVRKITTAGVVSTLAGNGSSGVLNGTGTAAGFGNISSICVDGSSNVYVYDSYLVRKITSAGVVTTLAGSGSPGYDDGTGTGASFSANNGNLKTDAAGNVYLVDAANFLIRKITPTGVVTTIAGDQGQHFINGIGTSAGFYSPNAITVDNYGNLYVSDGNVIRQMNIGGYNITTPLPLGLSVSSPTGVISGTPGAASAATTYTVYGNNSAGTASGTVNITVIYPPLVTTTTPATAFASMGDVTPVPVVIDGGVTVTDPSKTTLASAMVSITGNFVSTEDVLGFTANAGTMGNIAGTYNSTTGVLALTSSGSTATLTQWQTALQSITYNDTNDGKPNVNSRTISFTASDGTFSTLTAATKTINLTYTPSHNARLSNLTISTGTLAPAFVATTTAYTATVSNSVSSITITPATASIYATMTVNGSVVTSGTATAIPLSVGSNTITTVVTAEDLSTILTYTVTITRNASQVITFGPLAAVTYGAAPYSPGATSTSSASPITYTSSNTAVATIVSGNITIVGAGTSTITASQAASTGYDPATPVQQTLTVNKAGLTITATNQTKTYGAANPVLTVTYAGFVNGDSQTSLTTQPTITTTATVSSAAGSYPVTASAAVDANYTISYVAGTLTVGQAALTITANNQSKTYGAANPTLTVSYSGFVNGDSQTSLTTQPAIATTAMASSPAGSYSITASGASDGNYTITYTAGTLTVGQAALTIAAVYQKKIYGAVNPTLTVTYTGFVNGDSQTSLTTQPTITTTATTSSPAGSYPITASGAADANYTITYTAATLTVGQAALTITATNQTKTYGAANPTLVVTYAGFVNGDSQTSLTTQPTISTTATASSPAGSYPITASAAVDANYTITYTAGTLTVGQAALTITANNQGKTYGSANPTLSITFTGFVNGDSQTSLTTQPTIATTATASSPAGSYPITASGAVDANYTIGYVAGTLTVGQAALTITANSQTKLYGTANPTLTVSYSGLVNGDTQASLTTLPTIATTAMASSPAGSYPITASGAVDANYTISYVAGTLTVSPVALTITATNQTKTYGAANPTLAITYTGFANGDTQASLTTQPTISTTATPSSPAGSYPITASGAVDANYTISYVAGTLTVSQVALTITATNQSKTYGAANPTLAVTYAGFVNGDSQTSLTTQPTISTTATASSAAGSYPITASAAVDANYTITYTAGTLTVGQAALTITATNQTKTYGAANPVLTVTYAGFVNGDSQTSLTTQPTVTTTATVSSPAGSYPVTASAAVDANYTISYVAGTLTVGQAALTITANNQSKTAGAANPTLTVSYSGFVNGDTQASLTTQPTVTTTATTGSPAGAYPITASGAVDPNYTISYVAGTLTVIIPVAAPAISYTSPDSYPSGTAITSLLPANTGGAVPATIYSQVSTLAGSGTAGAVNGTGTAASFKLPFGVATDVSGNVYVADYANNLIREISPAGVVTTLAGSGTAGKTNGTGAAASFKTPYGVALDASGNVYVADQGNNLIRKITQGGVVTTFAGSGTAGAANGTGTAATFNGPTGVALDASGNVYVADEGNNLIREISPAGVVTTMAGSGTAGAVNASGTAASFNQPFSVATDASANVYVADNGNNLIREISPAGVVTTFAGSGTAGAVNGTGIAASFNLPHGVGTDGSGNVYVADEGNKLIRKITPAGVVTTLAGTAGASGAVNGTGTAASFYQPTGVAADAMGNVYVADYENNLIRKILVTGYTLSGTLPPGLSFNGTTGTISGTPTAISGATAYSVTAYNSGGNNTATVTISIYNPLVAPAISYTSPQSYPIGTAIASLTPANTGGAVPATTYSQVTTLAGSGTAGALNGTGTAASFHFPFGVATDASGNVYVADYANNLIREISPAGVVTTLAGSGSAGKTNGTGTAASFNLPHSVALDASGNVYVADASNNLIRKITQAGVVTTFAGSGTAGAVNGTGTTASFNSPTGVALDASGNVYVADEGNNLIREISPAGVVTTMAGSGTAGAVNATGTAASFNQPFSVATDASANVYVADNGNNLIRKITQAGVVTTFAGSGSTGAVNGTGTAASFNLPHGVATDVSGNVYVADEGNKLIRIITPAGVVSTLAGTAGTSGAVNGTGTAASFYQPTGVATDVLGNVYVADYENNLIRKILITGYTITPALPAGLAFTGATGVISGTPTAVSAATAYTVTAYNAAGGNAATVTIATYSPLSPPAITYTTPPTYTAGTAITTLTPTNSGGAVPANAFGQVTTLAGGTPGAGGFQNGTGTAAYFSGPIGIATDAAGNVYVADQVNELIRKITPAGVVTTFAGSQSAGSANGTGTAASFNLPEGVATDASANVYVADYNNNLIRKITPAGVVTTLAGSGSSGSANGTGTAASFNGPIGVATDASGNVYVADQGNNLIRKITPAGVVTTFAGSGTQGAVNGTGTAASFYAPRGVATDASGNVYVADFDNFLIRKITPAGVVSTLAGTAGTAGSANGTGTAASFNEPSGVTTDALGNVYVADYINDLIRKITPAGVVTTLAGTLGVTGAANGTGAAATFYQPSGVAADALGNVYVADFSNDLVRKIIVTGYAITPALPTGLSFNATTGTISGTPAAASAAVTHTISAYNTAGSSSAMVTITVIPALAPPNISYTGPHTYPSGTAMEPLPPTNTGGAVPATIYDQVTTFAGSGTAGAANGTGTAASFKLPFGVGTDASGNVYVGDYGNNLIREISPAGVVTTLAGSGSAGKVNGTGTAASFNLPHGVAIDPSGNVYVADEGNNLIRKITPAGVVTTLAGSGTAGSANGTGSAASFNQPYGVALDASGNVYVADAGNNLIREISPAGVVTTLAGSGTAGSANGTGTAATFNKPTGVALDAFGNVYVADETNNLVREITQAGVVTTFAGTGTAGHVNGAATAATFYYPLSVATDALGDVYVADEGNKLIREISAAGVVTTLAGISGTVGSANGIGTAATFNQPSGVATDASGNLYIADYSNNLVRKITVAGYTITPALPAGLSFDGTTGIISGTPATVTAATTYTVTAYNPGGTGTATVSISVFAPLAAPAISYAGPQSYTTNTAIASLTPTNTGGAVPATVYTQVSTLAGSGTAGAVNGTGTAASFKLPYGIATDASGNVYIGEYGNNLIREISPAGVVTTLAGSGTAGSANGTGTAASFKLPYGVAVDVSGNLYVADEGNNLIRKITQAGVVTTFAGSGTAGAANGTGTAASFNQPYGIATDASGNVYVGDAGNNLIREISPAGVVTTLAGTAGTAGSANGTGTAASFSKPTGIATDAQGNVYVADNSNNLIRKITQAGVVTTLAGTGASGHVNGAAAAATFYLPLGVSTDAAGDVYVADEGNKLIREISAAGVVTTVAGISGTAGAVNGTGTAASFNQPTGVATDGMGNVYVADYENNLVRKIVVTGYTITPALPAGLSFNNTTGVISGTPTTTSPATTYTITAYNTGGNGTATVSITVNTAPGPKVYYMGPQRYTVNTIITPLIPTNTGGEIPEASFVQDTAVVAATDSAHRSTPGVQFSRFIVNGTNYEARKTMLTGYGISPALPAGLSLDNSTGTISGIPTADIPATDFTITAYNLQGNSIAHLTITVNSLDINGKITKTGIDPYQASLDTTALAPIVHQAVSPNGDGKDDFLLIENITSYPDNKITLVDRNGALVYRAEGYDNANKLFDGHSSLTGALQKPGTYFYLLEYVDNGKTKRQTGFFVLKY